MTDNDKPESRLDRFLPAWLKTTLWAIWGAVTAILVMGLMFFVLLWFLRACSPASFTASSVGPSLATRQANAATKVAITTAEAKINATRTAEFAATKTAEAITTNTANENVTATAGAIAAITTAETEAKMITAAAASFAVTTTAQANATGTAQANAEAAVNAEQTATAQFEATAAAQTAATATAEANAGATAAAFGANATAAANTTATHVANQNATAIAEYDATAAAQTAATTAASAIENKTATAAYEATLFAGLDATTTAEAIIGATTTAQFNATGTAQAQPVATRRVTVPPPLFIFKTPTLRPTATATIIPATSTSTPSLAPTSTATPRIESPTASPQPPVPTTTPVPVFVTPPGLFPLTPVATSTLTVIYVRSTPDTTPTPRPTTTGTITTTPTSTPLPPVVTNINPPSTSQNLPRGTLTLHHPLSLDVPTHGLTVFEWEWVGDTLSPRFGFEVSAWLPNEFRAGVHDAVKDNAPGGEIMQIGPNRYQLSVTDIQYARGVLGRTNNYLWTVGIVQVNSNYVDYGLEADPAQLRYENLDTP